MPDRGNSGRQNAARCPSAPATTSRLSSAMSMPRARPADWRRDNRPRLRLRCCRPPAAGSGSTNPSLLLISRFPNVSRIRRRGLPRRRRTVPNRADAMRRSSAGRARTAGGTATLPDCTAPTCERGSPPRQSVARMPQARCSPMEARRAGYQQRQQIRGRRKRKANRRERAAMVRRDAEPADRRRNAPRSRSRHWSPSHSRDSAAPERA